MVLLPRPSHGARTALSTAGRTRVRCCRACRACRTLKPPAARPLTTTARPRLLAVEHRPSAEARKNGVRRYATAASGRPEHVAVLGGGLTGLSTAWYLTKFMPDVKVTIYEGSGRYGGWIDSEKVEVTAADGTKGTVVFERGARLVQPKTSLQNWDDVAFYELLVDIKPDGDGWKTAQQYDRYFYYPDHLVRLPRLPGLSDPVGTIEVLAGLAVDVFREPLYRGMPAFVWNMLRGSGGSDDGQVPSFEDVSIGDEFLRRGGGVREPIDNLLSAMCHGIYGGDVWKLSAESSIFGAAFVNHRLRVPYKNPLERWTDTRVPMLKQDRDMLLQMSWKGPMAQFVMASKRIKAFNFGEGFGAFTDAIVEKLKQNRNVKFVNQKVTKVGLSATGRMEVTTPKQSLQYDKVISSLYSKTLASLAPRDSLPTLASSTAVTIRLVNLWSPTPNLNHGTKGFGYLIPQTVPAEQNPHAALGVIFDSDRTSHPSDDLPPTEPAHLHPPPRGDTVPGTKLTVMLGGHHWDDIPSRFLPEAATDDAAAVEAAKATVRIQMGIRPDAWTAASTKLCVDCIPQHLVGHTRRMEAADAELRRAFNGKLAVVGGSYTAPGVVGSIRAARDVAWQVAGKFHSWVDVDKQSSSGIPPLVEDQGREAPWTVGETGLARFVDGMARHWHPVIAARLKSARSGT